MGIDLTKHKGAGQFLKAEDLEKGKQPTYTITGVREDKVGDDNKLIVDFEEIEKPLVCNVTNTNSLMELHGEDTDKWVGKQVTLFKTKVTYNNQQVDAVRIAV